MGAVPDRAAGSQCVAWFLGPSLYQQDHSDPKSLGNHHLGPTSF